MLDVRRAESFILIDELTNATAGAGIIWYPSGKLPEINNNS
jgi:sulfate adenylyltransferase subunit 1 (EFTu-like GTPase family)